MPNESVASALPPGAGRYIDLMWPNPFQFTAATPGFPIVSRGGDSATQSASQIFQNNGGVAWSNLLERMSAQWFATSTGAGNGCVFAMHPMVMQVNRSMVTTYPFQCDDRTVYRVYHLAAYLTNGTNNYGGDNNFELCAAGGVLDNGRIISNLSAGIGFKLTNDNEISLITRPTEGGALTSVVLLDAGDGFDMHLFHCYEFRVIQATPNTPATLKVMIDNVELTTRTWPNPTLPGFSNGINGFKTYVGLTSGMAVGLFTNELRFQCSQTEIGIL